MGFQLIYLGEFNGDCSWITTNVLFFAYLFVLFIDLKELPLLTCKEILSDFKLETYKDTNRIFHFICHAENIKWQLDIKTYRGRQQLQTGKQRQRTNKMSDSCFRHFCFASCLKSVFEIKTSSIKTKSVSWFEWEAGFPKGLMR